MWFYLKLMQTKIDQIDWRKSKVKAIMYHYVREEDNESPYFIYLHAKDFEKQIDYLKSKYKILNKNEFEYCLNTSTTIKNGIVLTFDDGFSDHYNYVYPILKKRNLWGIFYIPTKPYVNKKLLDVHRIHYLLGKYGGESLYKKLTKITIDDNFIKNNENLFSESTYTEQNNDVYTTKVKQIINYYLKPDQRSIILEKLLQAYNENENHLSKSFYLSKKQISEMIENGMSIANHGHSHTLFSNLDKKSQAYEIKESKEIIDALTNDKTYNSFCYPYGGKQSYNKDTLQNLQEYKYKFAFSVESRDIESSDLDIKYELPRYDCNKFKFGRATKGIK